jgi:signal transduction histidine kinase
VTHGFGLLGLRERASLVGGTLSIRSERGHGFVVEMEVPG